MFLWGDWLPAWTEEMRVKRHPPQSFKLSKARGVRTLLLARSAQYAMASVNASLRLCKPSLNMANEDTFKEMPIWGEGRGRHESVKCDNMTNSSLRGQ